MSKPNLSVKIGSMDMQNPVTVASGTFGYGPEYAELVDLNKLGAITVKGIAPDTHLGNPTPRTYETREGMLNAIGLPGPGAQGFIDTYIPFLSNYSTPVIVNIWGKTIEEYGEVVEKLDDEDGIHAYEINLSCPNIKEGGSAFGTDVSIFSDVIKLVHDAAKTTSLPIIGMGGIFEAEDAIEFLIAGATAIAVGTANFIDPNTAIRVIDGIENYLIENKLNDVKQLVGTVNYE